MLDVCEVEIHSFVNACDVHPSHLLHIHASEPIRSSARSRHGPPARPYNTIVDPDPYLLAQDDSSSIPHPSTSSTRRLKAIYNLELLNQHQTATGETGEDRLTEAIRTRSKDSRRMQPQPIIESVSQCFSALCFSSSQLSRSTSNRPALPPKHEICQMQS
jgi:hypothetical protein